MIVHVSKNTKAFSSDTLVAERPEEALLMLRSCPEGEPKRVIIHEGTYYATRLVLTPADAGLVIESAGEGRPILSGGVIVDNWRIDPQTNWFCADVPYSGNAPMDFRLLLTADGKYLKKARYPLDGELTHCSVFTAAKWAGSIFGGWGRELRTDELDHFVYKPEDISEDFDAENAEVQVFHSWNESYVRISRNDRENHTLYLNPVCGHPPGSFNEIGKRYAIYNTVEGMAEDGRWYCDRKKGIVYYRPYPGESVENFSTIIPLTTAVIFMEDNCKDITIRNIDLTAATSPIVTEPFSPKVTRGAGGFCSMEQDGALMGSKLYNIHIEGVDVYNSGAYGIKLRGDKIWVKNCHIHHCGAGGIAVCLPNTIPPEVIEQDPIDWPSIEGCQIEHIGLDYPSSPGIFTESCMVRGNYIAETSYSGVVAHGDYIVIEDNIVIDPMLKMEDGAALYKHLDRGGIIRNNYCEYRKGSSEQNPVHGLYLDAPGEDWRVHHNIVKGFYLSMHCHVSATGIVWHDNYFEQPGDMWLSLQRSTSVNLINNIWKCTGKFRFSAPKKALGQFSDNIIIHGEGGVVFEELEPNTYDIAKTYAFTPDESNLLIMK